MNNDFVPWIRPTLTGPFITTWGLTTLAQLASGGAALATFGTTDEWLFAMLLVSFFAGLIVTSLIASDLVLLRLKLRKLPTGFSAWFSSLAAPIAVWFAFAFFGLGDGSDIGEFVVRVALPILAVPFFLRLIFGRAP